MTRLLEHYDPHWKKLDDKLSDRIIQLAHEICDTPRWRWLRRATLSTQYREAQRELMYLREAADLDTQQRMLVQLHIQNVATREETNENRPKI